MTEAEIKVYEAEGNTAAGLELTPVEFRVKPGSHWAVPMVTGNKFYLRWDAVLDFEKMTFQILQDEWNDPLDKDIVLEIPFNDVREAITVDGNDGVRMENNTLGATGSLMGGNLVRNDTELMMYPDLMKRFGLAINGNTPGRSQLNLEGWRCIGTDWDGKCDNEDVPEGEVEDTVRLWSDIASWDDIGRLPVDDDDVVIQPTWNMVYDLPADGPIPKLKSLQING